MKLYLGRPHRVRSRAFWLLVLATTLAPLSSFGQAASQSRPQTASGILRGQVTDPSGAVIVGATVLATRPDGSSLATQTSKDGTFEFRNLGPGAYTVKAVAQGFNLFSQDVVIGAGESPRLNIQLTIEVREEKVEVSDSSTQVSVDPSNNAAAVVLRGKDLEQLSDDPDELQSELQALAGPSAGPDGGQIYIDGFTGGQLPPKASIREIRINQNPFSSEFDKLGYGRIEIFTKPGTDQFHGQLFASGTTAAFNGRNPFAAFPAGVTPPGYNSTQYSGNVGGPLSKRASFFFNVEARRVNDLQVVNTPIVDPATFAIVPFSDSVANPGRRINLSPRFDLQLTPNNTLTARYQFFHNTDDNEGVGLFNLAENGFSVLESEQTVQLSDTQIIGANIINESRFQFTREINNQSPNNATPAISVQGAFSGGGNGQGASRDTLDRYEIQNYTSVNHGKHFIKFGVRLREYRDENFANSNFNGDFTFGARQNPNPSSCPPGVNAPCPVISGIQAYQLTVQGLAQGQSLPAIIAAGGGASQYSITIPSQGVSPTASFSQNYFDAGPYVQDDFRVRPNITLSLGLRYEVQNHLSDHSDFAPRLGLAWGIGRGKNPPKTVLRAGYGIFYDRFTNDDILAQQRLSGLFTQQIIVNNPAFYLANIPPPNNLQSSSTGARTIYTGNPNLRTPYIMQAGFTLERQITKAANLAVTYLNSRGVHQFFTENINPPICSSLPCDPNTAPRANGPDNIYQYQSEGIFKQSQFIVNSSVRLRSVSLFGYYVINNAHGNTNGISSFPSLDNNISLDYGRTRFDIRQRLFMGGTISLPMNFRLSPFVIASTGIPYTITTGQDLNGDSIFNDRPSFSSPASNPANVVANRFGSFDLVAQPGEALVPVNSLTSPGRFTMNLRLSKTFGFGRKKEAINTGQGGMRPGAFGRPGGGGHNPGYHGGGPGMDGNSTGQRYSLTLSVSGSNIFNHVNFGNFIGNLSSPLFGFANGPAGRPYSSSTSNRRIDLQATFTF